VFPAASIAQAAAQRTVAAAERTAEAHARWQDRLQHIAAGHTAKIKAEAEREPTLFCFVVVRPNTSEVELVAAALELDDGLKSCDHHVVYSNVTALSAPGVPGPIFADAAIRGNMDVPRGGVYNTAMNTPVFQQVYRKMFYDKQFGEYDWVVKLDADAVVSVSKLRSTLAKHNPADPQILGIGHVMRGCAMAVTSGALARYAARPAICEKMVDIRNIGEDWYLTYCMKFLGVPKVVDEALVVDSSPDGQLKCDDAHAVFHPAADAHAYRSCAAQMRGQNSDDRSLS
jgi:hypothetical protein